ncbi:MAG: sporulation protein YqfD [Oscillospiraceae bacterium]
MKKKDKISSSGRGLYFGRLTFTGWGGFQEKLLSDLIEQDIPLRGVRLEGGIISGEISPLDYYRASKAARKRGVRLKAGKRRGLYFLLSRYSRRFGLYVGLLVFMGLLTFHQSRVESIVVEGAPEGVVLPILAKYGITEGADKENLQTDLAEYDLKLSVENIAWADVSLVGNRVYAHIEYGTEVPEMEDNSKPRNLIASRAAVIVGQTVRKGSSVLLTGSGTNKGGLLVSGTVPDGGGNVLFVRSDAEIIGEFHETKEFFVPFNETLHIADGEKTVFKSIILRDDVYPLYFGKAFVEDAVYSEETNLVFWGGVEMPFKIRTGTFTAYREEEITRSPSDCTAELAKQRAAYEENFYGDYEITACEEKYYPEEDGVRLVAEYTLRGNIAVPQEIEME